MKPKNYIFKKHTTGFSLIVVLFIIFFSVSVTAQITYIPDHDFEQALIDLGIDSDGEINGQVLTADIDTVTVLNVRHKNIKDLTGIEDFRDLEDLELTGNHIKILDTSENLNLKILYGRGNPLEVFNITQNQQLEVLNLSAVHTLNAIDLSGNINLEVLTLFDCWLHELDVTNNINLKKMEMDIVLITEIDLSNNIHLEYLDVDNSGLETIDVSHNTKLKEFYCGNSGGTETQKISEIDLSNNVNLEMFFAENLFEIEYFNAKNGNNSNLQVILSCFYDGICDLTFLKCIEVDDAQAANSNEFPYNTWYVNADFNYSEDCTLGITTPKETGFYLSKNPVHQNLKIAAPGYSGTVRLEIYSINGKQLKHSTVNFAEHTSLDVSELSAGVYVLKIVEDSSGVTTKRFIKK